jgi:predicted 3-demethylubiquinone-9 3-methyltransferase (glyoxalase superfamily)
MVFVREHGRAHPLIVGPLTTAGVASWKEGAEILWIKFKIGTFLPQLTTRSRYGDAGPGQPGKVMTMGFELEGLEFVALNGGPHFKFTEAISLFVNCATQAEVDELWARLSDGGEEQPCGWLKDKYGLSWQIIPQTLMDLMQDKDAAKAQRVMQAMLQMRKIDIAALQRAYAGA